MRDPKRTMCASVLAFETIVLALMSPVLIVITGLATPVGLGIGLGLAALAIVAAGMLRSPIGYYLGTLVQVLALVCTVFIGAMAVIAVIFGSLWATAWYLGVKIERERAAYGES
ncbi:DUF4233 domain-containing protein [Nocardioidaceae bacterium]|nr:DUF4233 domain-containing protein [Nocardioidaceae bacterium]